MLSAINENKSANRTVGYQRSEDGIWLSPSPVNHQEEDFNQEWFNFLSEVQQTHFWNLGRRKFVWSTLQDKLRGKKAASAIDLGGGCGGWVKYLSEQPDHPFQEIALGDSSVVGLKAAQSILSSTIKLYQVNVNQLQWKDRWDTIFMLDVLEHIESDGHTFKEVYAALKPGGIFLATVPALDFFWSYNDEFVGHYRRYRISDFKRLAKQSGFQLELATYFNFLLSPAVLLSRLKRPKIDHNDWKSVREHIEKTHRVPARPLNTFLAKVFESESWLRRFVRFPWGTSLLGVFRKV